MEPVPNVPTLYHVKWYCSSIPVQFADELSLTESQLAIKTIEDPTLLGKDQTLLRLSPRKVMPVLALPDGSTMCESGAIALYMCEMFDKDGMLHPLVGMKLRPRFLQGVVFVSAECYRAVMDVFMKCFQIDKKDRDYATIQKAKEKYEKVVVDHLAREMKDGRPFYLGEQFSLCDIMFGYILMAATFADENLVEHETLRRYYARLSSRPSFKKIFSVEDDA